MKNTPELLDNIKKKLEEEKERIVLRLESLKIQDPFSDPDRLIDNAASDAEANEETSHDRVEAIEKELVQKKGEIEQALLQLEVGSYGTCQNCGNRIEDDRLIVNPTAMYCMDCEKKLEKK